MRVQEGDRRATRYLPFGARFPGALGGLYDAAVLEDRGPDDRFVVLRQSEVDRLWYRLNRHVSLRSHGLGVVAPGPLSV
jgi:hypothetical protein